MARNIRNHAERPCQLPQNITNTLSVSSIMALQNVFGSSIEASEIPGILDGLESGARPLAAFTVRHLTSEPLREQLTMIDNYDLKQVPLRTGLEFIVKFCNQKHNKYPLQEFRGDRSRAYLSYSGQLDFRLNRLVRNLAPQYHAVTTGVERAYAEKLRKEHLRPRGIPLDSSDDRDYPNPSQAELRQQGANLQLRSHNLEIAERQKQRLLNIGGSEDIMAFIKDYILPRAKNILLWPRLEDEIYDAPRDGYRERIHDDVLLAKEENLELEEPDEAYKLAYKLASWAYQHTNNTNNLLPELIAALDAYESAKVKN